MRAPPSKVVQGAALLVALLISGCLGGAGKSTGLDTTHAIAPPGAFDESTGAIEGLVTGDDLEPIAGAVASLGAGVPDFSTALDGHFSFSFLKPGDYDVRVTAVGFNPKVQTARVSVGQTASLIYRLDRAPNGGNPYASVIAPLERLIGCSVGLPIASNVQTTDYCKQYGINPNANNSALPPYDVGVPITGAVYEVAWKQTSTLGGSYLSFKFPIVTTKEYGTTLGPTTKKTGVADTVRGKSPLQVTLSANRGVSDPLYTLGKTAGFLFDIRASGSTSGEFLASPMDDGSSKLVYDQKFTLYITLFYNGEPIPQGYTQVPPS